MTKSKEIPSRCTWRTGADDTIACRYCPYPDCIATDKQAAKWTPSVEQLGLVHMKQKQKARSIPRLDTLPTYMRPSYESQIERGRERYRTDPVYREYKKLTSKINCLKKKMKNANRSDQEDLVSQMQELLARRDSLGLSKRTRK